MNKALLLTAVMLICATALHASQTVRRYLRLSDNTFSLTIWGDANSRNLTQNSISINGDYCSAGWDYSASPLDLTGYDKLVVKLAGIESDYEVPDNGASCVNFRLRDNVAEHYYSRNINTNQLEFEINLKEDGIYGDSDDQPLNLAKITSINFWSLTTATISIKEIYLEKTLADGEKEFDTTPFPMTQEGVNYKSDGLQVDEANWTFPVYGNDTFAGWDWSNKPQDWSKYKYLVIVPQVPNNPSTTYTKPFQVHLSDGTYNFQNGDLRQFEWNRRRAMVIDLSNMGQYTDTDDAASEQHKLTDFNTKGVQALWVTTALGNAGEYDFGVSAIYLTNTAPTWDAWLNAHTAADFVISNDAADQYYTVCLPYNSAVCGAYAYSVKGADKAAKKLVLQRHNGILEAGVPYILRSNQGAANGVGNVTFYRAGDAEVADGQTNGALQGAFLRKKFNEADATKAVLDTENSKWVAADEGAIATANGAYIDITKLAAVTATADDITIDIDADLSNITSGIQNVKADGTKTDNSIYDLSGRRVSKPAKGLYIQNGRKFIVK